MKTTVFKDQVKMTAVAGNGGNGSASFRREKFVPRGGPDGGDGARGGHVILKASKDVDSLVPVYFRPYQKAEHGGHGGTKQCTGRRGEDHYVVVPCGTVAKIFETGDVLGEVIADSDELRVARGGNGGIGNCHFVTSSHQAPREFTEGTPGEQKILRLELKMVADVGLVGYPNAGKSTLLRALTNAHPKVASYPFTTLHPIIGTIEFEDYSQVRIADIPGLIDGAHEGVGLGLEFLRHIERTGFLIFVLDMAGTEGRDPMDDYENLQKELLYYDASLTDRPRLVIANKMDEEDASVWIEEFTKRSGIVPLETSAELGEGIEEVRDALFRHFNTAADSGGSTSDGE